MTEAASESGNCLLNGTTKKGLAKADQADISISEHNDSPDLSGGGENSSSLVINGEQYQTKEKHKEQNVQKVGNETGKKDSKLTNTPVKNKSGGSDMGCTNTRAVIEPGKTKSKNDKGEKSACDKRESETNNSGSDSVIQFPDKENLEIITETQPSIVNSSSDNVFCDQVIPGTRDTTLATESSDSGVNRSRNASRTSESTNSDTEKAVPPSESASESTEKVVRDGDASSDITDIEETPDDRNRESEDTPDDGNRESSSIESGSQNRPHSLSLPKPLQFYERQRHKGSKIVLPDETSSDDQVSADSDISSLGSSLHGTILRKGELIEFVADNLQEKIRGSRDSSSMGSRTSSMRSISSVNSISSYTSSMATSVSGMSRSPSSLVQQSPDNPPIDPQAVHELEAQARVVADRVDLMMGNLKSNLFKMSAITVGTLDAYKHSVDNTCDAVDASIKSMYALMAKCEELSKTVKPVYQLADQIKEIKRLLDLFESQLDAKTS